jgi:hypothetical protein
LNQCAIGDGDKADGADDLWRAGKPVFEDSRKRCIGPGQFF